MSCMEISFQEICLTSRLKGHQRNSIRNFCRGVKTKRQCQLLLLRAQIISGCQTYIPPVLFVGHNSSKKPSDNR